MALMVTLAVEVPVALIITGGSKDSWALEEPAVIQGYGRFQ